MHKAFAYSYALCVCVAVFALGGILRIQEAALFFGASSVPDTITVKSAYGNIILIKTAYAPLSFWFAEGVYSGDVSDAHPLENSLVIKGGEVTSFSSAYPEWRVFAVMKARDAAGNERSCNLKRLFQDATLKTYDCALAKEKIISLSIVFIKPTSLHEKINILRKSLWF